MVEARSQDQTELDFEQLLNQLQMQNSSSLRSLISYADAKTKTKTHFIVMQKVNTDNLYVISKHPSSVIEASAALERPDEQPGASSLVSA